MRRVGIFLAYNPGQSIRKEGLGRLLAFFIKGAVERSDFSIVIACPQWYREELNELLNDHDIDRGKVEFLTTGVVPYAWRIREWMQKRGRKPKRRRARLTQLRQYLKTRLARSVLQAAFSSTPSEFARHAARAVGFLSVNALMLVVLAPVLLVRRLILKSPGRLRHLVSNFKQILSSPITSVSRTDITRTIFKEFREREISNLIESIDARNDISGWLVPTLFWPEVKNIKSRTVVVAPDIVFFEQPIHYGDSHAETVLENAISIANHADHLITYSEYVRDAHLVRGIGINKEKVSVIRHGRVSMADYLTLGSRENLSLRREIALNIIDLYQASYRGSGLPFERINFDTANFVFYSSQIRPHKNILMLIKAVEAINRVDGRDIKLILTATIQHNEAVREDIYENQLENIVFTVHNIPSKILASLACLARLAVTPTLFEGGFPFTFCEAYSVGTPSILSDIPVIREVVQRMSPELQDRTLFDPRDVVNLKSKILWGLENRQELYDLQAELYDAYPTWQEVAGRYLSLVAGEWTTGEAR